MNYPTNTSLQCNYIKGKSASVIIFVDARITLAQAATIDLEPGSEIIFIDLERDGIEQITEILIDRCDIQKLQIIGSPNGNIANLQLGLAQLNIHTLEVYVDDLFQWRNALSASSEIILCGLGVVLESSCYRFMQQLADITGANIGAFVSLTDDISAINYSGCDSLLMTWQA